MLKRLRIGEIALGVVRSQFPFASLAHGIRETGIFEAGEVEKRRGLPIFLSHEQQRQEGRAERQHRRQLLLSCGDQAGQPLAAAGIGDLIVILNEADELFSWPVFR